MWTAAVAGASGYAGGEILRLLLGHPQMEIGAVTADSSAGKRLAVHPHLTPLGRPIIEPTEPRHAGRARPGLPRPAARRVRRACRRKPDHVIVLDCGADFRSPTEAAWTTFYDTPYAGRWPYGLPGASRGRRLHAAARPYRSHPDRRAGVLSDRLLARPRARVRRRTARPAGTSSSSRPAAPRRGQVPQGPPARRRGHGIDVAFGVGGVHRHTPEIEQNLAAAAGPGDRLVHPTLAPMSRGILATCTARLRPGAAPGRRPRGVGGGIR
ncbi:MAG: N-acetyl-gamma-glutamyl-phosphate reductase [Actinomycetales bacterium]|uniref:N-acetyl-gamma-glutamyl-phosphate reductase n=1 Tax=Candidatus Phosphoribacter hodrii TaxID=2953743 RepID=A0A9D7XYE2_9MICO|nr:N-acetyl-gamma-glutamyl-phosphate reductase [Candidatus Phosphoribacter hodrii]